MLPTRIKGVNETMIMVRIIFRVKDL